ncbi:uncharacterized protein A1O5_01436 [Cladophialophora psammophila CBS 110553]|uniref:Uncharacterized protein n=1 Tax=Cladophialophora psammophila CBS 110553 TaxID=1182543 RepID=W9XCS5_9EURO|nr:uncharacterized protein A1O5_01436 [Cladophialophora psammophila CBS 110553]EXJ74741.1 hypothetical protein A1O5_01436 [Cladophialophora psammophila CBS 110553]
MGFWPFGGGKKSRITQGEDQGRHTLLEKTRTDLRAKRNTSSSQEFVTMGHTATQRGQDEKPRRLSKQRLPSHPGNVPRAQTLPITGPGRESLGYQKGSNGGGGGIQSTDIYSHNPMSQTSIGPEDFTALPQAPTLLARRPGYDPTLHRRKSSKRKAEDYAREREVRAMSSPIQALKRPITYSGSGPLRRDTKQIPGDLNRRLQRPTSEVSLPLPETIQESEDFANQASFKIGILAALSPRPTLTYVASPRPSAGKNPARVKPSVQQAIEEEDPSSKKRINELADELDAGGLRELMDRDRRRKERKKEADRARLERKLQRKADRQREEELRGRRVNDASGDLTGVGEDAERRGRATFGNYGETSQAAVARRPPSPTHKPTNPFGDPGSSQARPVQYIRNPFEDEKDIDLTQESFLHEEEEEEPPVPVRSPLRTVPPTEVRIEQKASQATTISPPISPVQRPIDRQSLSQTSGLARELTPDIPEHGLIDRRASDQSSQQLSSWTSFFRRGGRRKTSNTERGRSTPSEFSNTSRESFAARKQQPPPVVVPRTFRRSDSSSVPQRTMSKFREDLPELPISPPDSRVQSPEVMTSPQAGQASRQPRHSLSGTLDNRSLATSSSNAALDRGAAEARQAQGIDIEMSGTTSGLVLSQSLASVDSEGSWLSGKPPKRHSGGMSHPLRQSQSSIPPQSMPGSFEPEDDDLANDEYLNKLSPGSSGRRDSVASAGRRASSNVIDLERERQQSPVPNIPPISAAPGGDETWHAGVGRQATVVRQPNRARSKEGLLKETGKDDTGTSRRASSDVEDEGELAEGEAAGTELHEPTLLRARSVDYKGHARHMSAGSARLLDIRRSSTQSERAPPNASLPQIVPPTRREQPTRLPKE